MGWQFSEVFSFPAKLLTSTMATPSSIKGSMPWRACVQCVHRQYLQINSARILRPHARFLSTSRPLRNTAKNPLRSAGNAKPSEQETARYKRSMAQSAAGIAVCTAIMVGVIKLDPFGLEQASKKDDNNKATDKAMKLDGPEGFPGGGGLSVIRVEGQDGVDQVATGSSTIPHFPSTIKLPKKLDVSEMKVGDEPQSAEGEEEYQLIGLGIRAVTFFRVHVYVVGMYIARADISELQQRLVRTALNPPADQSMVTDVPAGINATSLVPAERQQLKELLLDPERGDAAWTAVLKSDGLRTAFRVVPVRDTDFVHLRDGWVRGITAKTRHATAKTKEAGSTASNEFQDDSFGAAMDNLKAVFGGGQRRNVAKGQVLVLLRNAQGAMDALYQPDSTKPMRWMGRVADERISRLIWLNYLAGKNVPSKGARDSIVDGVMGIVERPVGTLVQRVL